MSSVAGRATDDWAVVSRRRPRIARFGRRLRRSWPLLLMFAPGFLFFGVFQYLPMAGLVIAFTSYNPLDGLLSSPWVGLQNFQEFFESIYASRIISNSIILNVFTLAVTFPPPIILALLLNEVRIRWFKRSIQTISYFPHFVATVIFVGMMRLILSPDLSVGVVNQIQHAITGAPAIDFLAQPQLFRPIYAGMVLLQSTGFAAIIYLANLASVDRQLYDAGVVDGANRFQLARYISLPALAPTMVVLLLLNIGTLMRTGIEAILLLYSPATYSTSDVIETFVYRRGILGDGGLPDYSYATAVGFFQSIVGMILIIAANRLARRLTGQGLW